MANNTCQWRCESGGRCSQPVKPRPGAKYADCFCPYHRTMTDAGCRTGAHIENILSAERTRITTIMSERRNKIRTYAATGGRLKIRTDELEAIAKLIGVELEEEK